MMTHEADANEIAKRYLIDEYLGQEPDYMSMVEWLDDTDYAFSGDDAEIHDAVLDILDTLAQRLEDEDN